MRCVVAACAALVALAGPVAGQSLRGRIASELFTFGTCGQPLCLVGFGQTGTHGDHFIPAQVSGAGVAATFHTARGVAGVAAEARAEKRERG